MDALEMGLKYSMFVTEEYIRQAEYNRYLEECVLIGINENTKEKIDVINESFADSIKDGIKKLWNAIVKMWHKFLEGMNTLFRNDQSYLKKYENVIVDKEWPEGTKITMHNYKDGVPRLVSAKIPAFNPADVEKYVGSENDTPEIAIKKKEFDVYYNGKYDSTDNVKTYLRGGTKTEQEYDATNRSQINMRDIYNYCDDCNNLVNNIKNSIKTMQSDVEKILSYIDKKSAENVQKQSTSESSYYSHVYNTYLTEEGEKKSGVNTADTTNKTDTTSTSNANKADPTPSVKVSVANRDQAGETDTDAAEKYVDKSEQENLKALSAYCKAFISVCGEFLGVKLTIAQEIYKMYMSIIKDKVRLTVGEKNIKNKEVKDTETVYDGTKDNVKMDKI